MTATLDPSDATADITWESSDETVVTVKDGELTGVGVGTATVTAKAGSIKAECSVTILPPTGAVLLLPAAGYYEDTSVLSAKQVCEYWSSTGFLGGAYMGPYDASCLFFRKNATLMPSGTAYDPRNRGFSIRPVTE